VYEKVTKTIQRNASAYPKTNVVKPIKGSEKHECNARYSEEQKEKVIAFEKTIVVFFMMVGMYLPEQTVHNKLVGEPSHAFHEEESSNTNKCVHQYCHVFTKLNKIEIKPYN